MSSPHTERPALLPSASAWNADAQLVSEALKTVRSAAAATFDDTRYLLPTLTWQIAAEVVGDCATTDHHARIRVLTLPAYALDAVWNCHAALVRAVDADDDSERLANLLADYLDGVHGTNLPGLIDALDRVLAVLTLDLPAARKLVARLLLSPEASPESQADLDEVRAAWNRAGVAC